MGSDYTVVLVFLVIATGMALGALAASWLIRPSKPSPDKGLVYECGERPVGEAWVQYNARYYLFALLFVIFDVEVLFLVPWAVIFREVAWIGLVEMTIFIGILLLGLGYAWKKQALRWY